MIHGIPAQEAGGNQCQALFPGYFGLVMATGIVSITAYNLGYHEIGWALFFCNIVAYALFWTAGLYRLVADGSAVLRELTDHETGAGFLTIVAGTSVLGSEFATFQVAASVVPALFAAAVLFWWGCIPSRRDRAPAQALA